jgi:hypothetical protein
MIEWMSALLSPIIGAGAGSVFQRFFAKKPARLRDADASPRSLAALSRQVDEVLDWQDKIQGALLFQERETRRLKKEIRSTRLMLDVFLVLLLAFCGLLWYFHK